MYLTEKSLEFGENNLEFYSISNKDHRLFVWHTVIQKYFFYTLSQKAYLYTFLLAKYFAKTIMLAKFKLFFLNSYRENLPYAITFRDIYCFDTEICSWPPMSISLRCRCFTSEPVFVNVYEAQESTPRNRFRQPM